MLIPIPTSCALLITIIMGISLLIIFPPAGIIVVILIIFLIIRANLINNDNRFISAIEDNNIETIRVMLDKGINVDKIYNDAVTGLIYASILGRDKIVELLLQHGARVDMVDNKGNTAIVHAVHKRHLNIIKMLLESGADPNTKGQNGMSLTELAVRNGLHKEIFKLLIKHGAKHRLNY